MRAGSLLIAHCALGRSPIWIDTATWWPSGGQSEKDGVFGADAVHDFAPQILAPAMSLCSPRSCRDPAARSARDSWRN